MTELEKKARELFYSLDEIQEYNRIVNVGMYPGRDRKSVQKLCDYIEKQFKDTIAAIESNEWYQAEKKAMEALSMKELMINGQGEYDPSYKVVMADVFRKVIVEKEV